MKVSRFFATWAHVLLVAAIVVATSACVAPRGRVYVRVGPPTPLVDVRVVAPGPGYVWISGYHAWNGSDYAWVPGRWTLAPRPRAVWVPGHWVRERRGWYFREGRWR